MAHDSSQPAEYGTPGRLVWLVNKTPQFFTVLICAGMTILYFVLLIDPLTGWIGLLSESSARLIARSAFFLALTVCGIKATLKAIAAFYRDPPPGQYGDTTDIDRPPPPPPPRLDFDPVPVPRGPRGPKVLCAHAQAPVPSPEAA